MAKSYITCTRCLNNEILVIGRNRKETDRKAAWMKKEGANCESCRAEIRATESLNAATKAAKLGLPALTGTGPQTRWAETLRMDMLEKLDLIGEILESDIRPSGNLNHTDYALHREAGQLLDYMDGADFPALKTGILNQPDAHWWIENRESPIRIIANQPEVQRILKASADPVGTEMQREAEEEATLRPTDPTTETIARISLHSDTVVIEFPEIRGDFRQVVKLDNGYSWTGKYWVRQLDACCGDKTHRMAEIAHQLLGAGFVVMIINPQARQLATSGNYTPEQKRWIKARIKGRYQGWLDISWGREDEFSSVARMIYGSRSREGGIIAPEGSTEEVLDFAREYGFSITPSAQGIIDRVHSSIHNGQTISQTRQRVGIKANNERAVLKPSGQEMIDASLLDHD